MLKVVRATQVPSKPQRPWVLSLAFLQPVLYPPTLGV